MGVNNHSVWVFVPAVNELLNPIESNIMKLSFRWYGPEDPVTLPRIRQIPALEGIVTALYDVPVGEVWPVDKLSVRKAEIEAHGLEFAVVESIPVHESIKLGLPERDRYIENYRRSIAHMGAIGVTVLCYNFMPVFDWTRTQLAHVNEDGSTALTFRQPTSTRSIWHWGRMACPAGPMLIPRGAVRAARRVRSGRLEQLFPELRLLPARGRACGGRSRCLHGRASR